MAQAKDTQEELKAAVKELNRRAPQKGGLFTPRDTMSEGALLDQAALERALELAREINGHAKAIGAMSARAARLEADRLALEPWRAYDAPLEEKGTRMVSILLGTVPGAVDFPAMAGAVEEAAGAAEVRLLSTGRQQHCLEILCHKSCEAAALEALRSYGFSFAQMKELTGTVEENLQRIQGEIRETQEQRQRELEAIQTLGTAPAGAADRPGPDRPGGGHGERQGAADQRRAGAVSGRVGPGGKDRKAGGGPGAV